MSQLLAMSTCNRLSDETNSKYGKVKWASLGLWTAPELKGKYVAVVLLCRWREFGITSDTKNYPSPSPPSPPAGYSATTCCFLLLPCLSGSHSRCTCLGLVLGRSKKVPRPLQEAEQQPAQGLESQGPLISLDGGNTLLRRQPESVLIA